MHSVDYIQDTVVSEGVRHKSGSVSERQSLIELLEIISLLIPSHVEQPS